MSNPDSIQVIGKRWFDRKNGNTYFSTDIYVNSEYEYAIPISYGYDQMYLQAAFEWLKDAGKIGEDYSYPPSLYCRENGIKLIDSVSDVPRKRDLVGG
jgi:hypothetical protein